MINTLKTYFKMLIGSLTSLNYYRNLPNLKPGSIIFFFVASYLIFGLVLAGQMSWQLSNNSEFANSHRDTLKQQIASSGLDINEEQVWRFSEIAIWIIFPILQLFISVPMLGIEVFIVYFAGRFEKRGLKVWTAIALVVHINLIMNILNLLMMLIYGRLYADLLYVVHWILIILIGWKGFKSAEQTT